MTVGLVSSYFKGTNSWVDCFVRQVIVFPPDVIPVKVDVILKKKNQVLRNCVSSFIPSVRLRTIWQTEDAVKVIFITQLNTNAVHIKVKGR